MKLLYIHPKRVEIIFDFLRLSAMRFLHIDPKVVKIVGYRVHFGDINLLHQLFTDIFVLRSYSFDSSSDMPVIIDAGANIGIAALFFKYQYPSSKVICFEPDATNFAYLKKNVESNALEDVQIHNAALYDFDGLIPLYVRNNIRGGDTGASVVEEYRGYYHNKRNITQAKVPCERLSKYLKEEIDLLKIDIEGSESRVFSEISDCFSNVRNMIMEYHYIPSGNALSIILAVLEKNSHYYQIISPGSVKPFGSYTVQIKSTKVV
jgi:FkbM family methyltransferase